MQISKFRVKPDPTANERGHSIVANFDAYNADIRLCECALVRYSDGAYTVWGPTGGRGGLALFAPHLRADLAARASAAYLAITGLQAAA